MKKRDLILFFLSIILLSFAIYPKPIGSLDELWNYNFAKNVADGLLPYRDFNMITFPFLPILNSAFLKLWGNELFTMRILNVLLGSAIIFITYRIFIVLKAKRIYAFWASFTLLFTYLTLFKIDYNFFVLFLLLIILYIELCSLHKNTNQNMLIPHLKTDLIVGLLAGLCICTKQTTGIIISLILLGHKLFYIHSKEDFKNFFRIIRNRILGISLPLILLLSYLVYHQLFFEFIDYCLLGIQEFHNQIPYITLFKNSSFVIRILAFFIPLFAIGVAIYLGINWKKRKKTVISFYTLLCYSTASCIVIFPISDTIHFMIGIYPFLITLIWCIYQIGTTLFKGFSNKKLWQSYLFPILLSFIFTIVFAYPTYHYLQDFKVYLENINTYTQFTHYRYIPIRNSLQNELSKMQIYFQSQNKPVYIADATACVYRIPIDLYTKNFDMFLVGNLGKDGENKLIKQLQKEDCIVLILNSKYKRNWQTPKKVIEYITYNMTKTGEISYFDIFMHIGDAS